MKLGARLPFVCGPIFNKCIYTNVQGNMVRGLIDGVGVDEPIVPTGIAVGGALYGVDQV